jgi:branched-chain amino acid transport system ATP-binding protein
VVIVEQNARRALAISGHAIVLELGQKRFEGTGEEIAQNEQVKQLYLGGGGARSPRR